MQRRIIRPVTTADVCAWCSMPIGDFERALRFFGKLYHPGCLIRYRRDSSTSSAPAPPA
jgi:hypothetical protein